jgi:hypothetical protein
VRTGRLDQREGLADVGANLPRRDVGEELTGEVGAFAGPDLKIPETGDRYLPPASVVSVDHGEGAAGRSVGGEAAAIGDDPVGVVAELAADPVENDRGTGPARCVQNRRRPARLAVVDDHTGSGLAHGVQLGPAPGRADDPRPACEQELDEQDAHAAGRAEDEDVLPGADVGQPDDAEGRRAVVDDRGGEQRIEAVGHLNRVVEADGGPLGVAATAARPAGVGDHRPSQPAVVDAVADGDHLPGDPAPRDVRRPDREEAGPAARPDHGVHEEHVAGGGGDDEFSGTSDGISRFDTGEHFRPAEPGRLDDQHGLRPRSAGSRLLRRRGSAVRAAQDRRCRR